jgi:H+/Cl- antiporter ClcA
MVTEPLNRARHLARWVALAVVVGALSGVLSAAFLESLDWATDTRTAHDWLVWTLPLAGLSVGLAYHYLGRGLERGTNLVIDQIHSNSEWIPLRLTPLIFVASVVSHVAGGSTGREGAALQFAAGVTDPISKRLKLNNHDRSIMLVTAIAGGFGSVFGVPVAGAVFAMEVQKVGRMRYEALIPAFVASFIGDVVVQNFGINHTHYPVFPTIDLTWSTAARVVMFGVISGLVAMLFVHATRTVKSVAARVISWAPARPMIGGVLIAALVLVFGWRDYQGLSVPLAVEAMNGSAAGQWGTKLALTSLTIGSGFVGGEFIPLFVVGALCGASFAHIIGANVAMFAIVGAVSVLAGATNAPLACTVLGIELFGGNGIAIIAIACVVAYVSSGHTGIYHAQPVRVHKSGAQPSAGNS